MTEHPQADSQSAEDELLRADLINVTRTRLNGERLIGDDKIDAIMHLIAAQNERRVIEARKDENDIWLAHSTSRRLVDIEPAIRTVDFQDRIDELNAALKAMQSGDGK